MTGFDFEFRTVAQVLRTVPSGGDVLQKRALSVVRHLEVLVRVASPQPASIATKCCHHERRLRREMIAQALLKAQMSAKCATNMNHFIFWVTNHVHALVPGNLQAFSDLGELVYGLLFQSLQQSGNAITLFHSWP
jgi:predicted nuclease with RNAse H fold